MEVTKAEDVLMHDHACNPWRHGIITVRQLAPTVGGQGITTNVVLAAARTQDWMVTLACPVPPLAGNQRAWIFRVHQIDFVGFIGGVISVQALHQVDLAIEGVVATATSKQYDQVICYGTGNNRPHHSVKLNEHVCCVTDEGDQSGDQNDLRTLCIFSYTLPAAYIANDDCGYVKFHYSFKMRLFFDTGLMVDLSDLIGLHKYPIHKRQEIVDKRIAKRAADCDKVRKIKKIKQLTLPVIDK